MSRGHVHLLTYSRSEAGALKQKRDESMTERIVRGVNHCRTALLAGYTTYRWAKTMTLPAFSFRFLGC